MEGSIDLVSSQWLLVKSNGLLLEWVYFSRKLKKLELASTRENGQNIFEVESEKTIKRKYCLLYSIPNLNIFKIVMFGL